MLALVALLFEPWLLSAAAAAATTSAAADDVDVMLPLCAVVRIRWKRQRQQSKREKLRDVINAVVRKVRSFDDVCG